MKREELIAHAKALIDAEWKLGIHTREDARFLLQMENQLQDASDEEISEDISYMSDWERP